MRAVRFFRRLLAGESGATTAEYAVLVAVVLLVCAVAVSALRPAAGTAFQTSGDTIGTYSDP